MAFIREDLAVNNGLRYEPLFSAIFNSVGCLAPILL